MGKKRVIIEYYGGPLDGDTQEVRVEGNPLESDALPFRITIPSNRSQVLYTYEKGPINSKDVGKIRRKIIYLAQYHFHKAETVPAGQ